MKSIIYKGAINSLSFGNVSYNLLRELYRKDYTVSFFPFGENLQFEAFDSVDPGFRDWVIHSAQNRFHTVHKDSECLSQWHLNQSENRVSRKQTLFSFYELDAPTNVEKSIVELQDNCIFSSKHAYECFSKMGCKNVHYVPIGFDEDFKVLDKEYMPDKIHFGLMGKLETRKNTLQILSNWVHKYGNNYKYQLTCCINNPFLKPDQFQSLIQRALNGKSYGNVNFLPHLKTNTEVNDFYNSIDIDLSGLSGAEGWNIPAFNSTALGKWSIVMNHTSHKDWANNKNSILINPTSQTEPYDGAFFVKGQPFNQGKINKINNDEMIDAFEKSEKFIGKINKEGLKLQSKFTYEKTLDKILKIIQS